MARARIPRSRYRPARGAISPSSVPTSSHAWSRSGRVQPIRRGDLREGGPAGQHVQQASPDGRGQEQRPDQGPAVGDGQRPGGGVTGPDGPQQAAELDAPAAHQRTRAGARRPKARWLSHRTARVGALQCADGGNAAVSMAGTNSSPRLLAYM